MTTHAVIFAMTLAAASACKPRPSVHVDAPPVEPPSSVGMRTAEASVSHGSEDAGAETLHTVGPGFPNDGPWVSFYGTAKQLGDIGKLARTFRIINIDADPGAANFTDAQLEELKAGGKNRVISYFNIGACEHYRTYWSNVPKGFTSCSANKAAQRGSYDGYPDETWMDPSDESYQKLILDHVAPRLAARVDGFYLDNLEILEHPAMTKNGPCSPQCKQGGLDLVRKLREKYPNHLIVMQNATSDVTRLGMTGGVRFPTLLDGIAHEEVYAPKFDDSAEAELLAWKAMNMTSKDGRPFWIAVEDYAGNCANKGAAKAASARAHARGFASYVSDESGAQKTVCYWD